MLMDGIDVCHPILECASLAAEKVFIPFVDDVWHEEGTESFINLWDGESR